MTTVMFIGDEVTAAAFRLVGATAQAPEIGDMPRAFADALAAAGLVIVTADYARAIDEDSLRAAIRRADPPVLVVPGAGNRHQPEDLDARIDRVLGIEG